MKFTDKLTFFYALEEKIWKDKIEAKVNDGVLHITLPRTAKAEKETKRIEVA